MKKTPDNVARKIQAQLAQGLTLAVVAERWGLSTAAISLIKHRKVPPPEDDPEPMMLCVLLGREISIEKKTSDCPPGKKDHYRHPVCVDCDQTEKEAMNKYLDNHPGGWFTTC